MFGYPVPKVPKSWSNGARQTVELLKKESSVEEFGVVHDEALEGSNEEKSVRGQSLRQFFEFLQKHDPSLKQGGKEGDFAGLQRIGDPNDGTSLWTKLTDKTEIAEALKMRSEQRQREERREDDEFAREPKISTLPDEIEEQAESPGSENVGNSQGKEYPLSNTIIHKGLLPALSIFVEGTPFCSLRGWNRYVFPQCFRGEQPTGCWEMFSNDQMGTSRG